MAAEFVLYVPSSAAGANQVHFDLFNASSSGLDLVIHGVRPIVIGSTAVVGTLAVDLLLTRTTAVGTGGTAATYEGTSLTAATFSCVNGDQRLNESISARLRPTGGATAGSVLSFRSVFTEETNAGSYETVKSMGKCVKVKGGTGIRVVQGSVASVGNLAFEVLFKTVERGQ